MSVGGEPGGLSTVLEWLAIMVPPSVVLLFGGIWVVSRRYGGWRHILGIAAIVLGVLLAIVTVVVLFGFSVTTRTASGG